MTSIAIRPLVAEEWKLFRDFRLAALKNSPGMFASAYEDSAARPDAAWREMLEGDDQRVFGLFDGETLIGISAAFTSRDDPAGQTALVAMGYLLPAWRGRGLSHLFHEACLGWIRAQPQFRRVLIGHRASNDASRGGIAAAGYVETVRVTHPWPDGTVEEEVIYELRISD